MGLNLWNSFAGVRKFQLWSGDESACVWFATQISTVSKILFRVHFWISWSKSLLCLLAQLFETKKDIHPVANVQPNFFWIKAISSFQKRREGSSWICSDCLKIQTSGPPGLLFHLAVHWSLCSYMEYQIRWYFVEFTFPICQLHFDKLQSPHWYVWTSNLRADSETFEHSENKFHVWPSNFMFFLTIFVNDVDLKPS